MEFYFQNGLALSTQKACNSAKKRYIQLCSGRGLTPLPASEDHLCQIVSSLANQKLCHSSIKSYLAAIRHLHIAEGYGEPNISSMARLEQVLIKSVQSKGHKRISRLPITLDHLVKMREVRSKQSSSVDGKMLQAAASLCFFGFLRSREITVPSDSTYDEGAHLNFADIAVDCLYCPRILKVRIKASKTDPLRVGVDFSSVELATFCVLLQRCYPTWWQGDIVRARSSNLRTASPSQEQDSSRR